MLEWVSVYWFSRAGPAASVRIYREMTAGFALDPLAHARWTPVPFGVAYFPDEVVRAPRKCVTRPLGLSVVGYSADCDASCIDGSKLWAIWYSNPSMTGAATLRLTSSLKH